MSIAPISSAGCHAAGLPADSLMSGSASVTSKAPDEVARQFEAILLRQMLSESMKPFLEQGQASRDYGYFVVDAMADSVSRGGGLGMRGILEAQLRQDKQPSPVPPPSTKPLKP